MTSLAGVGIGLAVSGKSNLIASGEASVEIIKKNINRKNRMSARAPVSTSDASLALFLKFIELGFRRWFVKNI